MNFAEIKTERMLYIYNPSKFLVACSLALSGNSVVVFLSLVAAVTDYIPIAIGAAPVDV